ncbi:MAG: excinuclease ABC subunit UvrA [Christensenellales bacterium]|jgi:excinuclease ABC subunit A
MQKTISIRGARVNNLKNISLDIPRGKLVVFTGLSGSGKSSLAFDTIYAEGQRRYVESMSSYARQFLGIMDKPDVDSIDGLSPAISIDQKTTSNNPRSTVGTVTEISDYLRLLYARIGVPHCPQCGKEISQQTVDQMIDTVLALPEGTRLLLLSPIIRGKKGEHVRVLENAKKAGFMRARIDGTVYDLDEAPKLAKTKKHTIELVVDRISVRPDLQTRLTASFETALEQSGGLAIVQIVGGEEILFSQSFACADCNLSMEELTPRLFSFNSPDGACPACSGLGEFMTLTPESVVPNPKKSINQGAIHTMGFSSADNENSTGRMVFEGLADAYSFSLDTPFEKLSDTAKNVILYGTKGKKFSVTIQSIRGRGEYKMAFEGIIPATMRRYRETSSDIMKEKYEEYMELKTCSACGGARLKPVALAVTVAGKNIAEVSDLSLDECRMHFASIKLSPMQQTIAAPILGEVDARLGFLINVGLTYLNLSRAAGTLSGGEAQRIRLATQIGSGLTGVLYILDEPSIGLHQRDNNRLLATLKRLRDLGNTLIVVEHDEETLRSADHLVDIGPGAGEKGGEVIAQGTVDDIIRCPASVTGQYLSGQKRIPIPKKRRKPTGFLTVEGAAENNLKNIDVTIPLGVFCCVSGVSGSGKSSLVNEILYKSLAQTLNRAQSRPGKHKGIKGVEQLDKIINIDQSPIGRTPRSNPATYTGLFDFIRRLFASLPEAKARGYEPGRFSFNVKGGRCEACTGDGVLKIEMHFMADVYVPCEVCHGKRYNRETLEIKYKGHSINDVLNMTVDEAMRLFENHPAIMQKLRTLSQVGLGYIRLGQSSTTLSGGEAQRVKLATELSRRATGKTMILLDEPTTGLHFDDVGRLIKVLQKLTEAGNSVLVIEHNLDVLKVADYIIDLGPEGGIGGGTVVTQGTPEEIAACKKSYTGQYLVKSSIKPQKE